jgi:hypothetical protein
VEVKLLKENSGSGSATTSPARARKPTPGRVRGGRRAREDVIFARRVGLLFFAALIEDVPKLVLASPPAPGHDKLDYADNISGIIASTGCGEIPSSTSPGISGDDTVSICINST